MRTTNPEAKEAAVVEEESFSPGQESSSIRVFKSLANTCWLGGSRISMMLECKDDNHDFCPLLSVTVWMCFSPATP